MQITDKTVAIVTGGASGLGGATVRRLVADGAKVVILDLPSSPGADLAAELGAAVRFAPTDVRDEAQVQAAIDTARELGELRIAVTCAGVATPGRVIGRGGPLPWTPTARSSRSTSSAPSMCCASPLPQCWTTSRSTVTAASSS